MEYIQCLLLILVANGAPIIARHIFHDHLNFPIDAGIFFYDKRPLFGKAKTIRGIIASIVITSLFAVLMDLSYTTGLLIGVWSMAGDLLASFIKRRLGITTSGKALGLDQIPESLFPLLAVRSAFSFSVTDIVLLLAAFIIVDILISRILYRLNIRKHPY